MDDKEEPVTEQYILMATPEEASAFLSAYVPNPDEGYARFAFHVIRMLASGATTSPLVSVFSSDQYVPGPTENIFISGFENVMRFKGGAYIDPFNPNSKAFFDLEEYMQYRASQNQPVVTVEEEHFPYQTRDEYWEAMSDDEEEESFDEEEDEDDEE